MKVNKYLNREMSWLGFNSRVLDQCNRDVLPLDKLKFISIYSMNLDEFYMIRMAGLKQLFAAGIVDLSVDKMNPLEQMRAIRDHLQEEKNLLEAAFYNASRELAEQGLFITRYNELPEDQRVLADKYFFEKILPLIIPIAVDGTHPFPPLSNLSFSIALRLAKADRPDISKFALIRIPHVMPRFFEITDGVFVLTESIIKQHIEDIFIGYEALASVSFRVTRNADIVIEEEEADDFMLLLERGLRMRRKGAFVRLQVQKNADKEIMDFLIAHTKVFAKDVYEYEIPLNLTSLMQIATHKDFAHLASKRYNSKILPPMPEQGSVFETISRGEVLCIQPYESFEPVTRFLKEAASDPKVISIRMTLYRVEKNSQIIAALIEAANDGKQVTVMVELKARFDEENNLHWAKELENAGAHVIYGITGFKVHSKVVQVIRQSEDGLKFYAHLGTGNYNASSAKIYSDLSFFTCDERIANHDLTAFFHILSGSSSQPRLSLLSMSPHQIKEDVLRMINGEAHEEGRIIMKMNAIVDTAVIKALYEAGKKGAKIDLLVRGICCLRPGVEGLSENIKVKSLVGKYLEHARIFYFKHSRPSYFMSSADMMPRNLERRLELMTPILDDHLCEKLKNYLEAQLKDKANAYMLSGDGSYTPQRANVWDKVVSNFGVKNEASSDDFDSQSYMEELTSKAYKASKKTK